MEVYECGKNVVTKIGCVNGIITAACIRFEKVQYEVSYFLNGERKEVWLDEREFILETESDKVPIGFKR